jgi:hypothetical protein
LVASLATEYLSCPHGDLDPPPELFTGADDRNAAGPVRQREVVVEACAGFQRGDGLAGIRLIIQPYASGFRERMGSSAGKFKRFAN